jgi:hypothetical protein
MTRHFSLRKVLSNTPKCLLREFFDKIGHQPLSLDWNRLPGRKPEPLMLAISLMDPVVQPTAAILGRADAEAARRQMAQRRADGTVKPQNARVNRPGPSTQDAPK